MRSQIGLQIIGVVTLLLSSNPLTFAEEGLGTIEGRVIYRADAKRRWRYARYYVKSAKQGHLAEAVVALRSTRSRPLPRAAKGVGKPPLVDQKNFRFLPETSAIQAGAKVTFKNSDAQVHNVRSAQGPHPFNVNMPPRGSHVEKFTDAGGTNRPVVLGCSYHSSMRAWIFVYDHPFFQVTESDGRFQLKGVPPGSHTIEMRHPAGQLRYRAKVKVAAGKATKIDIVVSPDHRVAD